MTDTTDTPTDTPTNKQNQAHREKIQAALKRESVTVPRDVLLAAVASTGNDKARPMLRNVAVWALGNDEWIVQATDSYSLLMLTNVATLGLDNLRKILDQTPFPDYLIERDLVKASGWKAVTFKDATQALDDGVETWAITPREQLLLHPTTEGVTMEHQQVSLVTEYPRVNQLWPRVPKRLIGNPDMHRDGDDMAPMLRPFAFNPEYIARMADVSTEISKAFKAKQRTVAPWGCMYQEAASKGGLHKPVLFESRHSALHPISGHSYTVQGFFLLMPVRLPWV